jgi:Xaa-Pro aminopeptidase
VIKSPAEQQLMRKAGEVSCESINQAIQITRPGVSEHQLFATVDYESRMRGAETLAYVPVVASGTNANIIHYIDNRQILGEGELVLMDAGARIFYNIIVMTHVLLFSTAILYL